jgi:hypothetical protein
LILSTLGVPRPQEEILQSAPTADRWDVVAQEFLTEDRLRVQHNWLIGQRTGQRAHVLSFAFGNQPFDASIVPGFSFEGEICRYPGEPLRALIKSKDGIEPIVSLAHATSIEGLLDAYATARSADPWIEGITTPLAGVMPVNTPSGWRWVDAAGQSLAMDADAATSWALVAISGGSPLEVVVHFDGICTRPLASLAGGQYRIVAATAKEEIAAGPSKNSPRSPSSALHAPTGRCRIAQSLCLKRRLRSRVPRPQKISFSQQRRPPVRTRPADVPVVQAR